MATKRKRLLPTPKPPLQVGKHYRGRSKNPFYLREVVPGEDGWIDPKKYLPNQYDLVLIKTPLLVKSGWHTGTTWDGAKLNGPDEVLGWKMRGD